MNSKRNNFTSQWAALVIKYRWWVVIASIAFTVGLASQGKMEFDGDYHAFFSESNPELEAFDALQEKYTKDDNILIALVPENGDVFTKNNLEASRRIANNLNMTLEARLFDGISSQELFLLFFKQDSFLAISFSKYF